MTDDNNKGFAPAFGGVVLIGLGLAIMNIPDSSPILALTLMAAGGFLAVKGLSK